MILERPTPAVPRPRFAGGRLHSLATEGGWDPRERRAPWGTDVRGAGEGRWGTVRARWGAGGPVREPVALARAAGTSGRWLLLI